jgi:hypothetical protein
MPGAPVSIHAELINATSAVPLRARMEPIEPSAVPAPRTVEMTPRSGGVWLELTDVPSGVYRVTVDTAQAGPSAPVPVHDIFAVAAAADEPG